jgi:hypothetical protein
MRGTGLLFQIGFNKCATSAFFELFRRSGARPLHSGGRFWRNRQHPALVGHNPQLDIDANIREGRPALTGFEDFDAFFDMEFVRFKARVENYRQYRAFARDYPHARFLLNHRDKAAWLRSRARHGDGQYIKMAMVHSGLDRDGVLQAWADDFDRHHDEVREFFRDEPDRLFDFDIDRTPLQDFLDFTAGEFHLDPRHWKQIRVTDEVVTRLGWTDGSVIDRDAA